MPYRDESEALDNREGQLHEELTWVDGELERLHHLEERRSTLVRELSEVHALRHAGRSPLAQIRRASPCSASWEAMDGSGCARLCHVCGKRVLNLGGKTRTGALALLLEQGVADQPLRRRSDGTVLAGDCPLGSQLRRRGRWLVTGGTSTFLTIGFLLAATATTSRPHHHPPADRDPNAVDGAAAVGAIEVGLDDEIDVSIDRPVAPRRQGDRAPVAGDCQAPSEPAAAGCGSAHQR